MNENEKFYDQGQYITLYVIGFIILFAYIIIFIDNGKGKYIFVKFTSFYKTLYFIPFLLIHYGPIIYVFHLSLINNFNKGCITMFFANIYTHMSVLPLEAMIENYYIYKLYQNAVKGAGTFDKVFEEKIKIKNNNNYLIWNTVLTILSIIFYFSNFFISECTENVKVETFLYIFLLCFSYIFLNISFMNQNIVINTEQGIISSSYFCLSSFTFFLHVVEVIVQQLVVKQYLSREFFFTGLVFLNCSYFVLYICIIISSRLEDFWFKKKELKLYSRTIGRTKLSFDNDDDIEILKIKEHIFEWKKKEKNKRMKNLCTNNRFY